MSTLNFIMHAIANNDDSSWAQLKATPKAKVESKIGGTTIAPTFLLVDFIYPRHPHQCQKFST